MSSCISVQFEKRDGRKGQHIETKIEDTLRLRPEFDGDMLVLRGNKKNLKVLLILSPEDTKRLEKLIKEMG